MVASDPRVAAELLEYYRRAADEAHARALFPRQSPTPPASSPAPSPSPSPSPPTTTTPDVISSTTSTTSTSISSTSSTDTTVDSSTSSSSTDPSSPTTATTPPSPTTRTTPTPETTTSSIPRSIVSSYVTTRTTTNSNGDVITTTEVVQTVVPVVNAGDNNSSSVNVGAIVGGVIGGIALIALLIGLFIWWRKKTRFDEFETDLFDPDRSVKRPMSTADPHSDLVTAAAVPEVARNITPYSYGNQNQPAGSMNGTGTSTGQSGGWQSEARPPSNYYTYDNVPSASGPHYPPSGSDAFPNPYGAGFIPQSLLPGAVAAGVGGMGAAALNRGPTVSSTASSSYYPQTSYPPSHGSPPPAQYQQPYNQPMSVPMPVPTPVPLSPRAAKEQEAFRRTHGNGKGGWAISNQGPGSGGSGGEDVVVHGDGGRASSRREEDEVPRDAEIPPTYESIRHDNPGAPTPPVQPAAGNN